MKIERIYKREAWELILHYADSWQLRRASIDGNRMEITWYTGITSVYDIY